MVKLGKEMDNIEYIRHFYKDKIISTFDCLDNETCEQQRNRHGYILYHEFFEFFYTSDELPFFEIKIYKNENTFICELWDHNGEVFCFITIGKRETFDLIKEYISIVKDLCSIEKSLKELNKDD